MQAGLLTRAVRAIVNAKQLIQQHRRVGCQQVRQFSGIPSIEEANTVPRPPPPPHPGWVEAASPYPCIC